MSQWIDRINNHAIWNELKALGIAIDLAVAREGNDAASIDGLERIRTVLAFCGKRLAATAPFLIEPGSLGEIYTPLVAARTELESYVTDGLATHIAAANLKADEMLTALASILAPIAPEDLTVINESISSYHTTLEKYLQEALAAQQKLKEASDANDTKISDLEAAIAEEQKKLATLVLDYQSQFSTAQDKRASEFSAVLADQQTKFAASAAEQQTLFSKDQDARNSDYAATQIANQEKFALLLTDYTQKLKDQDKAFIEQLQNAAKSHDASLAALESGYKVTAEEILKQINKHKKDVEDLVGVIGNLGVTSGYQKVANFARKMLFIWQGFTVLALGGLIIVAITMAYPSLITILFPSIDKIPTTSLTPPSPITPKETEISAVSPKATDKSAVSTQATIQATPAPSDSMFYQGLATRIFLSLTFGVFAAYAARQASHFLEMERKNRKLALELEALGPYIEPLDKEKQDEFRLKIGDRSFGVHDDISNKPKSDDPVTAYDMLKPKEWGEAVASLVKGLMKEKKD